MNFKSSARSSVYLHLLTCLFFENGLIKSDFFCDVSVVWIITIITLTVSKGWQWINKLITLSVNVWTITKIWLHLVYLFSFFNID